MYRLHPSWVAVARARRVGPDRPADGGPELVLVLQRRPGATSGTSATSAAARCTTSAATTSTCRGCCSAPSPTRVQASIARDPATGVDVLTSAILDFDGGVATFTCSTRAETDQRVHIYGTDGPDLDRDPVQHPARPADRDLRHRRRRSAGRAGHRDADVRRRPTRTRARPSGSRRAVLDGVPLPVAARGRGGQPARDRARSSRRRGRPDRPRRRSGALRSTATRRLGSLRHDGEPEEPRDRCRGRAGRTRRRRTGDPP